MTISAALAGARVIPEDDLEVARRDDARGTGRSYARRTLSPRALLARLRALDPHRLDLLLAVVVGVEMQVEASFVGEHQLTVRVMMGALTVAVALRRRFPFAAFVAALVPFVVVQGLGRTVTDELYLALFLVLFMNYSVAANAGDRAFRFAPPIAFAAGILAGALDDYAEEQLLADLLWLTLAFIAGPMVAGRLVRSRTGLQRALRAKAEHLERERRQRADRAVLDERTRIAGELHDIVAHALTEMTLQATAAGRLAERDPERAREAFGAVEGRGREALGELRRLLGVLRRDDEELALAPQPSMRHLDALVRRARSAGLPVELTVDGEPAELPAGIDVTGYRVVQEALNGALNDHGAEHAAVRVSYGPDVVALEVDDDGSGTESAPLLGLRERVALYGGELQAAPRRDGGHLVRARLPREVRA